jgi:DNA-binding response OmpR family regulator
MSMASGLSSPRWNTSCSLRSSPTRAARCTRDQLLDLAHHKKWAPYDRSIDMRIAQLRKKIEFDPAKPTVLKTMRGEGYMLVPEAE